MINFPDFNIFYIFIQTLSVLHPLKHPDAAIMQDTDLAGPLVFCLAFGGCLLLVSSLIVCCCYLVVIVWTDVLTFKKHATH